MKTPQPKHRSTQIPLITLSPDALLYLLDEGMVISITPAGEGKINVTATKKEPVQTELYEIAEQDGIRMFFHKEVSIPSELQVRIEVKKRMFFTSIRAFVEPIPKGAGFMGTRGCR